jgi:hypothetical protein
LQQQLMLMVTTTQMLQPQLLFSAQHRAASRQTNNRAIALKNPRSEGAGKPVLQ